MFKITHIDKNENIIGGRLRIVGKGEDAWEAFRDWMIENDGVMPVSYNGQTIELPIVEAYYAEEDNYKGGFDDRHLLQKGECYLGVYIGDNRKLFNELSDGGQLDYVDANMEKQDTGYELITFEKKEFGVNDLVELLNEWNIDIGGHVKKDNVPDNVTKEFCKALESISNYRDDLPDDLEEGVISILSLLSDRLDHGHTESIAKMDNWPSLDFHEKEIEEHMRKSDSLGGNFPSLNVLFRHDEEDE